LQISGGPLACNALLNFIGQAMPLGIGVVAIPFIVRGLEWGALPRRTQDDKGKI